MSSVSDYFSKMNDSTKKQWRIGLGVSTLIIIVGLLLVVIFYATGIIKIDASTTMPVNSSNVITIVGKLKNDIENCTCNNLVCKPTSHEEGTSIYTADCKICYENTDCPNGQKCTNNDCVCDTLCPDTNCGTMACGKSCGDVCLNSGETCTKNKCVCDTPCPDANCGTTACGTPCGYDCQAGQMCKESKCIPVDPTSLRSWFTQEKFDQITPSIGISSIYADDGKPVYTYTDFMTAVDNMNKLKYKDYHNFGTDSKVMDQNKREIAAFFANAAEEIGTGISTPPLNCKAAPSIHNKTKRKTSANRAAKSLNLSEDIKDGALGSCIATTEGALPVFYGNNTDTCSSGETTIQNTATEQQTGCQTLCLTNVSLTTNADRGLSPTATDVHLQGCDINLDGLDSGKAAYACVASNGQLWQGNPSILDKLIINPETKDLFLGDNIKVATRDSLLACPLDDPSCRCLPNDFGCQYVGRGPTQLTGNVNYTDCSLALFDDIRLVKWPNLITATNRETSPSNEYIKMCVTKKLGTLQECQSSFAFSSSLPLIIKTTTPPARVLLWMTAIFFWMDKHRSVAQISSHDAMLDDELGFSCAANIINGNGCYKAPKITYYPEICNILEVTPGKICKSINDPDFDPTDKCNATPDIYCQTNNDCPDFSNCNTDNEKCTTTICNTMAGGAWSGTFSSDCGDAAFTLNNGRIPCCCTYPTHPNSSDHITACQTGDTPPPPGCDASSYTQNTSEWTSCSKPCNGGTQTRTNTTCVDNNGTVVDNKCCTMKPVLSEPCNTSIVCPPECLDKYHNTYSEWSSCSRMCGGGQSTRKVKDCRDSSEKIADKGCCTTNPDDLVKSCNTDECQCNMTPYTYNYSAWSDCSKPCDGQQTRTLLSCVGVDGLLNDNSCCPTLPTDLNQSCNTNKCPVPDIPYNSTTFYNKRAIGDQTYEHPDTSNLCLHGGDLMSCSGHGICAGTDDGLGKPWQQTIGPNGLQVSTECPQDETGQHCVGPPHTKWFVDPTAACQCYDGWNGVACQIPPGKTENPYGFYKTNITHYTPNVTPGASAADLLVLDTGAATTTNYSQLTNASGMCGQNYEHYHIIDNMPYEIDPTTAKIKVDANNQPVHIQAGFAINAMMFGERVHRPDLNWANADPVSDGMAAGKGCGTCWKLSKTDLSGKVNTLTGVVIDRCGGNCISFPAIFEDPSSPTIRFTDSKSKSTTYPRDQVPDDFILFAGKGANWRDMITREKDSKGISYKPFFAYLTNGDCSNMLFTNGAPPVTGEQSPTSGWAAARAASPIAGPVDDPLEYKFRQTFIEWTGNDIVDWCFTADHPHFDVSADEQAILCKNTGEHNSNCVADSWEAIPCTAIGVEDPTYWPNGCDRTSYMNCGSIKKWDPFYKPPPPGGNKFSLKTNWSGITQRCCDLAPEYIPSDYKYASEADCKTHCDTAEKYDDTMVCGNGDWTWDRDVYCK